MSLEIFFISRFSFLLCAAGGGCWQPADLHQMFTEMECVPLCCTRLLVRVRVCVCFFSQILEDCLPLNETGRRFAGLYCRVPLPIVPLIRAATARHAKHSRSVLPGWHALRAPSLHEISFPVASRGRSNGAWRRGASRLLLIGGSGGSSAAPLFFLSSGCSRRGQCQICCKAIKGARL